MLKAYKRTMAETVHLFTARNLLHATSNTFHTFRAIRNVFDAVLLNSNMVWLMSLLVSKYFKILSRTVNNDEKDIF